MSPRTKEAICDAVSSLLVFPSRYESTMEAIGCDMIFLSHAAPSLALRAQRRCESNVDVSRDRQKLQICLLSLLHFTARPPAGDARTSRNPDPDGVAAQRSDPLLGDHLLLVRHDRLQLRDTGQQLLDHRLQGPGTLHTKRAKALLTPLPHIRMEQWQNLELPDRLGPAKSVRSSQVWCSRPDPMGVA